MKHIKTLLYYCIHFLPTFLSVLKTTFFTRKNLLVVVLILFTLTLLNFSFLFSFASATNFSKSNNEQKMSSRVSNYLDSHDSITPQMKEKAIKKIIDFNNDFKIIPTNEARTLRKLFFVIQETFLKEYVLYASFFQTIDEGKFDCLTGSLLYAIFLEEIKQKSNFDYNYYIVQMPTHVFIKIELSDKSQIIFESTNFDKGFIATQKRIDFYLEEQAREAQEGSQNETSDEYLVLLDNKRLNNLVTLESVLALLYFNQGVSFFNQRKFGKSFKMAKNAFHLQKNEIFYKIVTLSLQELVRENVISKNEYLLNINEINLVKN